MTSSKNSQDQNAVQNQDLPLYKRSTDRNQGPSRDDSPQSRVAARAPVTWQGQVAPSAGEGLRDAWKDGADTGSDTAWEARHPVVRGERLTERAACSWEKTRAEFPQRSLGSRSEQDPPVLSQQVCARPGVGLRGRCGPAAAPWEPAGTRRLGSGPGGSQGRLRRHEGHRG